MKRAAPRPLLLRGGHVVTPSETIKADVLVRDETIAAVAPEVREADAEILDVSGLHVLPGVIDAHTHLRDFEWAFKEDFASGTRAAAVGGVTTVLDMPNNNPPTVDLASFKERRKRAEEQVYVDFGLFLWATAPRAEEFRSVYEAGAVGFKIFTTQTGANWGDFAKYMTSDLRTITECMDAVAAFDGITTIHAESQSLKEYFEARAKSSGLTGLAAYLAARPAILEDVCVFDLCEVARFIGGRVHFAHLGTAGAVKSVRHAKAHKARVTAEAVSVNLLLTGKEALPLGTFGKFSPGVAEEEDREALWEGVREGTIDVIASDHGPHALSQKQVDDIWEAVPGTPGVETLLPLMLTQVAKGRLTLNDVARVMSENPAKIYRLYPRKGSLQVGADADLTVVDLKRTGTIDPARFMSKAKFSPFKGWKVRGLPVMTFVRGTLVAKDGDVVGPKGHGKFLIPSRHT